MNNTTTTDYRTDREIQRDLIIEALAGQGIEALYGKGGFWLRGQGWVTFAAARKLAGVKAPERNFSPKVANEWMLVANLTSARRSAR